MAKHDFKSNWLRSAAMLSLGLMLGTTAEAQIVEKRSFASQNEIQALDNTTFCTAFLANNQVYTLRDIQVCALTGIDQIAFNPTGSSIALMSGKDNLVIYSFRDRNRILFNIKDKRKDIKKRKGLPFVVGGELGAKLAKEARKGDVVNLAMCFAEDARSFVVSNSAGEIITYDTRAYLPQAYIQDEAAATALAVSSNNYFIAAATGDKLTIWNMQTRELRKRIPVGAAIQGIDFSADASMLALTTADGHLHIYDTKKWEKVQLLGDGSGSFSSPTFHPTGKYVGVLKNNQEILIYNLKNEKIEQTIDEGMGKTMGINFFADNSTNDVFLFSNRNKMLVFWDANGLNPYYGKLLGKEVDSKMNEWVKLMQGESMEEYAIRVNDETRAKQQQLFAQEVATGMAGNLIENPFIDAYNAEEGTLNIGFNSIPSIALSVPADEAAAFGKDAKNLKFDNAVYVLNDKDEFELAYVEVMNETTGKTYIYDNIGRTRLTALEADDKFVPLEVMQQASREEIQLKEIKEQVVEEKKQDKLITENTQIDVRTEVVPGVDANGNKILNYKVSYKYEVINKAFSAKEDFPSGGYNIERSNAAMSLMKIIKNAFEGDFSKYLAEGKQVKVIITGSADASPIRGTIAYNGMYGEYVDEPYYKDGNLDNITVTKASGITSNEQLALMRAAGVKNYIEKNVTTLGNTKNEYEYHVEVAAERGGEFRKINVEFVIMDAFPLQ